MVNKGGRKRKSAGVRKVSLPTKFMLLINFFFIALLISSLLACLISPAQFWPLAFTGISYPVILVVNLFFVLFWLVFLKKYFLFSLIAIALGYNQFNSFIQFHGSSESITDNNVVKVMSYNVRLFDLYNWNNQQETTQSRKQIFELIDNESPDILCLQEYYSGKKGKVNYADTIAGIGKYLNYYDGLIDNGKRILPFGLVTFSRYPIVFSRKINFDHTYQNFCILTDIAFPADTIRVINTHLESFKFRKEDYIFVNELANTTARNDITQGSRAIFSKMRDAYKKRAGQADELAVLIAKSPHPVLLCADFNDTPTSYAYRQIARTQNDAFVEAGSGVGQSYRQWLPVLRIDYIFSDKSMKVVEYKTVHNDFSDHYPIVARVKMQE